VPTERKLQEIPCCKSFFDKADETAENEMLLKEGDRQFFEDILVNNISKKIGARIFNSEKRRK
jgi:hypothetical protein